MRVTHVITRLVVGGAQENTIASVLGLKRKPGFHLDLISGPALGPEGSLVSALREDPQILTLIPTLVRAVHPVFDFLALRQLTRLFRARQPDLVHTHSGKAGVLGRLAAARAGVPIIVHTIHGPSFGDFQGPVSNRIFKQAERYAAKVTTHFVTVADAMTRQYLAAGIGRPDQYTRIFSGFEAGPFLKVENDAELRRRLKIEPGDVVVGKIARLFKLKGHDDLLDIAPAIVRRHPGVKFLIIGDGPWRERLQNRVYSLALVKNFIFAGLISPSDVPRYIGLMDIVVHLSRREGLPRALPQAAAAARPVIAYDCDGANEVCRSGETGFLVRPGDLEMLTGKLLQLIESPSLRQRMGRSGRDLVRDSFSVETMVEKLYNLYLTLAAARSK